MRTAWLEDAWEVILPQEGGLNQLSIEAGVKQLRPLASEQEGFGSELKLQSSWWDQAVAKVPPKPHLAQILPLPSFCCCYSLPDSWECSLNESLAQASPLQALLLENLP